MRRFLTSDLAFASSRPLKKIEMSDPFACFGDSNSSSDNEESGHHPNNTSWQLQDNDELASSNFQEGHRLKEKSNSNKDQPKIITPITNDPSFELFNAGPHSGKGLRATAAYKCGDEILRESAAIRIPNSHPAGSLEDAQQLHQNALQRAYNKLHHLTKTEYMDLSSCNEEEDMNKTPMGIYNTNSFRLDDGGKSNDGALFLTIARMNHSCLPNCNHIWRDDLQKMVVFATRDCSIGEELCTSYGPSKCMTTKNRREYLYDRFSFECKCVMCMEGNTKGGDEQMTKIQSLQEDIAMSSSMVSSSTTNKDDGNSSPQLESVKECLELMDVQGIGGLGVYTKSIYHHGYNTCTASRDMVGARAYLVQELKAVQDSEGVDSPRAVEIEHILTGTCY